MLLTGKLSRSAGIYGETAIAVFLYYLVLGALHRIAPFSRNLVTFSQYRILAKRLTWLCWTGLTVDTKSVALAALMTSPSISAARFSFQVGAHQPVVVFLL